MVAAVDTSSLADLLVREATAWRDRAAAVVLEVIREAAPVSQSSPTNTNPGRLRDDLRIFETYDDGRVFGVALGSELSYAGFTDEVDTSPHEIRAVNAPVLRFWWESGPQGPGIYRYRSVQHPGTKGQRWFASENPERWVRALEETAP